MKTELEHSLSRLEAPAPPQNLKERCMNTIPAPSATSPTSVTFHKKARPFLLPRVAIAGALMFSVAAGAAFWSTRPPGDGIAQHSGSVLFAQVLEAAQRVSFCHVKGRQSILGSTQNGSQNWWRTEFWFDASRGFYNQSTQDGATRSRGDVEGPVPGGTLYDRGLVLSDGRIYDRVGMSSTVYAASDPNSWKSQRQNITAILTAQVAGTQTRSGARFGQVLSSTKGSWKGQAAQILVLERQPAPGADPRATGPVRVHMYVNPDTKLVIALQEFATPEEGAPQLIGEYEIDYSRPDAALFDPRSIQEGARVRPFPGASKGEAESTPEE